MASKTKLCSRGSGLGQEILIFCGLQGRGGLVNPINIMDWTPISLPLEGGEIFLDYKIIVVIIMSIQWHLLELQYYIQLYYILICWNISYAYLYSLTLSCVYGLLVLIHHKIYIFFIMALNALAHACAHTCIYYISNTCAEFIVCEYVYIFLFPSWSRSIVIIFLAWAMKSLNWEDHGSPGLSGSTADAG